MIKLLKKLVFKIKWIIRSRKRNKFWLEAGKKHYNLIQEAINRK